MIRDPALPLIYCPIDTVDIDRAKALAAAMQKAECGIKLGLEFFNANGPQGVREIRSAYPDLSLFIDLKYHDIPNTVAGAVRGIAPLQPDYLNLHATGGLEMMRRAHDTLREESQKVGDKVPRLLGVTILTSLDEDGLAETGFQPGMSDRVAALAQLTQTAGLEGIVCAAHEIAMVRALCGPDFVLMVPGIRPAGADTHDQKRVMTPEQAVQAGATHLVIGRPITGAEDPEYAARTILESIDRQAA